MTVFADFASGSSWWLENRSVHVSGAPCPFTLAAQRCVSAGATLPRVSTASADGSCAHVLRFGTGVTVLASAHGSPATTSKSTGTSTRRDRTPASATSAPVTSRTSASASPTRPSRVTTSSSPSPGAYREPVTVTLPSSGVAKTTNTAFAFCSAR